MEKQKIIKWALPALMMSAMTFELMPGSVREYNQNLVSVDGYTSWNFFNMTTGDTAAKCLALAGAVTFITMVLALAAACFQKFKPYRIICWGALTAGTLTTIPYMLASETRLVQPNVVVILILIVCWLMAAWMGKKKDTDQAEGKRL